MFASCFVLKIFIILLMGLDVLLVVSHFSCLFKIVPEHMHLEYNFGVPKAFVQIQTNRKSKLNKTKKEAIKRQGLDYKPPFPLFSSTNKVL